MNKQEIVEELNEKKVRFRGWNGFIDAGFYENDRIAIELIDLDDYSPLAVATINIPEVELDDDEVFIKDYSENEGMVNALIEAGIIDKYFTKSVDNGHVTIHAYKLKY